jgi:peptidoglycan hydrolase-like protein with peptidoglycan-binding domain
MATIEQKYIQWVQRTLNRELRQDMVTNGVATDEYREAVETFQLIHDLPVNGQVGPSDQNKMIKANHESQGYINWSQLALYEVGAREKGTVTGVMDKETIDSIKSFQAYHKLNDDGWIGAKTEMELIEASGMFPPGHRKSTGPAPKRPKRFFYDNPRRVPVGLPVDKIVTRIISSNYYDAFYHRTTFSSNDRRLRLCLLGKLKQRSGIDDHFPSNERISYAYHGSVKYLTANSLFLSARGLLTRWVEKCTPGHRLDPDFGRQVVTEMITSIKLGVRASDMYRTKMRPSSNPLFPSLIEGVADRVAEGKRKTTCILSCFA